MRVDTIAGSACHVVGGDLPAGAPLVVLLHGFAMTAGDLSPFAEALAAGGLGARFVFPEGPVAVEPDDGGRPHATRAWWRIDVARRARETAVAPRDLSGEHPDGLDAARAAVVALLDEAERRYAPARVVLGGFSQGAMLTCDTLLRTQRPVAGAILLSGARIAADVWAPLLPGLRGLPILQAHGRADPDLSFDAAEALSADLAAAGADVTWVPFDGAHETPLVVWRAVKKFLTGPAGFPR